ncbi:MAG: tRNA (adenosine(37)-N6)-dimethylallyltransferase MiaA [Nitrospinota bacterium]|nr:MAG: tRNA (adenosine(37)-N6)-dimethylallyltransferase MiaA [Nitrospinota bacterium]
MRRERNRPVVLVLMGPTAVGKTTLALTLAQRLHTEIISADAIQVYKGMDIGTAKPTPAQRRLVPHHMIDLRTPDQPYSAAEYAKDAGGIVQRLWRAGKLPLVVGGSGLYIRALLQGVFPGPAANWEIRRSLYQQAEQEGREAVHARLQACDPEAAARIHPHDLYRTVRALEVYYQQGVPISTLQRQHATATPRYQAILIGLTRERPELYHRINERAQQMIEEGLVAETAFLLQQGYSPRLPPLQSLGYKQVIQFLQGKCSLQEAIRWIQRDTRHYAKRQLTWMRKMPDLHWINLSGTASSEVVEQIMNLLRQQGFY